MSSQSKQWTPTKPNCPRCGKFCYVVYEWRGPSYTEVEACGSCGYNMVNHPELAEQVNFDLEAYRERRQRDTGAERAGTTDTGQVSES